MELKISFLSANKHFKYPLSKPKPELLKSPINEKAFRITERDFRKVIMENNHLVGLSNLSLTVFHFDEMNKLVNEFQIENKIFLNNFKERLKKTVERGGFISPFQMFLDSEDHLCFMYYNTSALNKWEVYRYKVEGTFLDLIRLPEMVHSTVCTDGVGNFYFVNDDDTEIGIFRIIQ